MNEYILTQYIAIFKENDFEIIEYDSNVRFTEYMIVFFTIGNENILIKLAERLKNLIPIDKTMLNILKNKHPELFV